MLGMAQEMKNAYLVQMRAKEEKMMRAREEEVLRHVMVAPRGSSSPFWQFQARMREELLKKFAEDDRLEQLNEQKRRMKVAGREKWHMNAIAAVKQEVFPATH